MSRDLRCRLALIVLALAPVANAQEPYASRIAEAAAKVERTVGLPFRSPPRFAVRTREEIDSMLGALFDDDRTRRTLDAEARVLRILGVIPDSLDWRALQIAVLREQVVGFYDPATKVLYLEDEPDDPTLGIVIPHELVHALQDQYENVDSLSRVADDDRALAARAALEGQATLVAFEVALGLGPDLSGSDAAIRESVEDELKESPVLSSAPLLLRRRTVFPYLDGLAFMARFQRAHPGAQPFGAARPVATTEILHPARYDSVRRAPAAIELAADAAAEILYENDFGEFGTRVLLEQTLRDRKRATRAADGWRGDRFALVRTAGGDAFAWMTVWNSDADAAEFADAARRMAARRWPRTAITRDGPTTWARSAHRTISVWTGTIDAHAVVLYADVPGTGAEPLDRARLHVRDGSSLP
jgi:hypothetical protein